MASLKLCAKIHTHIHTAVTSMAKHIITITVNRMPGTNMERSILILRSLKLLSELITRKATAPPMDITLSIALTQAITDTARNLLIIISRLVTGRVRRVSRVPLSLSPAVTSIAG